MVRHSSAWETFMTRSEESIFTERKTSESGIEVETRSGSIVMVDFDVEAPTEATRRKERLLNTLKREVKIIMEESVNRKAINAKSTYVTSLCAAVEQCLLDGLKRRLLGLFGGRSTYALLHNIAKFCPEAATVLTLTIRAHDDEIVSCPSSYLWIRFALLAKILPAIIGFIHNSVHCRRYYEKNSLILDAAKGGVVAALLVGPCAIDYTMMDHQCDPYEEPLAGELVERHRSIHSCSATPPTPKRPPLTVMKRGSSIVTSVDSCSSPMCTFGRDYVYSLHQNVKASLLYGKNNVTATVSPDGPPMKGYLSLHQNSPGNVTVKWSPNQLMHSSSQPSSASCDNLPCDGDWLWRHIININISDIIYIHIHQYNENSPTTLIFVGGDGVQHSPMQFPAGHHLLAFLSCLESGLAPYNRLDPPLWFSREKGKILPKLRRKSITKELNISHDEESKSQDYVFRLVSTCTPALLLNKPNHLDETMIHEISTINDSTTKLRKRDEKRTVSESEVDELMRQNFKKACSSMRMQILARTFYGWLAYCGHLRTIRNHLSCLVDSKTTIEQTTGPVNEDFWKECRNLKSEKMEKEFLSRTYRFGISGNESSMLRRKVWPYLLGLVNWTQDFEQLKNTYRAKYYNDVVEWEKIEKIVRERDREAFVAARIRYQACKAESNPSFHGTSLNNEVFEENNEIPKDQKDNDEEDIMEKFSANLHRIEKDVERCDRSSAYFAKKENLQKLKTVMCTYVWRNLNEGYTQGMCDLAAPLLVILDDEPLVLACFDRLMLRMKQNFPQRTGMDDNLAYMNSLLQVMDPEFLEYITENGDAIHLSFTYRWFLLDFKREFTYPQVFRIWEVIWAASSLVTTHFHLFLALAMIIAYRHIIIDNRMDFTDIIKFYNEMAERHNVEELLDSARNLLKRLQTIIVELEPIKN
uniref:Rab-GAP TBC domain-containing protein n=3 Tax=Wuchereria bancrofti TaxID=6293 RepID=A0AAF5PQI8_WUCBA